MNEFYYIQELSLTCGAIYRFKGKNIKNLLNFIKEIDNEISSDGNIMVQMHD
ncbi:hypothetical protein GCM10023262_02730 [Bartonella pachyuromydis]|uniref:Uncharacterized protein n=1 Tax=Bartonella pachyuromydis TaxID=931097 RepID=A0ABP8VCT1_9HYPH